MAIPFTCTNCGKRLKVPDDMAGKRSRCPTCSTILNVPDMAGGAETPSSPPVVPVAPPPGEYGFMDADAAGPPPRGSYELDQPRQSEAPPDDDREPCPVCGEMIRRNAAKCRFCGEIFDDTLRRQEKRRRGSAADTDLSAGDWVLAILCSTIGCIMGFVWLIQGKPKAGKMIGVSFLFGILWGIVNFVIQSATQPQQPRFR